MENFHDHPEAVSDKESVNEAIRDTWYRVCDEFPNATTPMVAKKTAEDYGISVERVFQAFTDER